MFKNIFLLIIIIGVVAFVFAGCTNQTDTQDLYSSILQKDKIVVGISFESKPFAFKDADGKIKGMEVDLAREIADEILGSPDKVEFRDIATQDRLNVTKNGDVDMVISMITITPQRKKDVYFSAPYFVTGQVICVKKDSKIESHNDLNNKRVIVVLETTGEKNIKKFVPNAIVQSYANDSEASYDFKNGNAEAITTDDSLLQGFVSENKDYIILPEKLTKELYGIAFNKSKNAKRLREEVNKIIRDLKKDGTLGRIKDKWEIY